MAIKPKECVELEVKEKAQLAATEKYIDDKLRKSFIVGEYVDIVIDELPIRVHKKLMEMYKSAGWEVCIQGRCAGRCNEPDSMTLRFIEK